MKNFIVSKWGKAKQKVTEFIRDEKSAKGVAEEGFLTYAGIVIGIIVLAIAIAFLIAGFTDIGSFFNDGVNGGTGNGDLGKWSTGTGGGFNQK